MSEVEMELKRQEAEGTTVDEFRQMDRAIRIVQAARREVSHINSLWGTLNRADKHLQEQLMAILY